MESMEPKLAKRGRLGLCNCFCASENRRKAKGEEAAEGLQGSGRSAVSAEEGDGVVRVKILMSKQELKQLVAAAAAWQKRRGAAALWAPQSLEQLIVRALRRRQHTNRAGSGNNGERIGGWTPALQSIPEED